MKTLICILFGFFFSLLANAEAPPKKLTVAWPKGWQLNVSQVKDNVLYLEANQQIDGKEHQHQHLQLTAMSPVAGNVTVVSERSIKDFAGNLRDTVLKMAAEKTIALQSLPSARGYYFSATDRAPEPDEFRQLTEGVLLSEGCLINFTLLTNDAESAEAKAMVAALDKLSIK